MSKGGPILEALQNHVTCVKLLTPPIQEAVQNLNDFKKASGGRGSIQSTAKKKRKKMAIAFE